MELLLRERKRRRRAAAAVRGAKKAPAGRPQAIVRPGARAADCATMRRPVRPAEHRKSVEAERGAGAQRRLEPAEDALDVGARAVVEAALQRRRGGRLGRGLERAQLLDARAEVAARRPRRELAERRGERDAQLQRRLALAAGGEVGAGAQRELLTRERDVAAGEERREALLGAQGPAPARSRWRR